jgi:hypothetical protein
MTVPHRLLIRLLHSSCRWLSTFLVYMLEPAFFTASHVNRTLSYDRFQVVRGAAATVTNVVASGDLVHNRTLVHALLHTPFQVVGCAVATLTNAMASCDPFLNRTGVPFQVVRGAAATVTNAMASGDLVHNRTRVPFQIDYNCTGDDDCSVVHDK